MRPRISRQVTQRDVRNWEAFASGGTLIEQPSKRTGKRGTQPESASNDAVQEWARLRNGVLHRNRRGMVDMPGGGKMPFGLGPNGYPDNVGYLTIQVTPEMLGRHIAVYCVLECKRADKAMKAPQEYGDQFKRVEEVRAAGGIAGFACNAEDAEQILNGWREGRGR